MSIILFHFESNDIRFVGTAEKPEWVAADICKVLEIVNVSDTLKDFSENQKGIVTTDDGSLTGSQMLTVTEAGMYRLIFKSRKPIAEKFQNWIFEEVLPSIRKTGTYSIEQHRQTLEVLVAPKPEIKQIDQVARMLGKRFGKAYEQRYVQQQVKKHYPALHGDAPDSSELASLPTAKALLTPTQIAVELSLFYKTGAGNPQAVNTLLEQLGYQTKIGGRWSATDKAIKANLVDRKPVETNSKTQKDQLLWSADIILILKEHAVIV